MIEGLAACFAGLTDPRETSRCDHQLVDILAIAVCAVVACAESWEDIALYGRSKRAWLRTFLALPNGIPSHDTFRRVFMLIDPDAFEACFTRWAQSLAVGVEREVVAVDGKTARRTGSRRHERGPLHLLSAWASERGLALGQRAVDGKSNEITAIPELLDTLRLEGCIVTLDAMGCQKAIAERIRARDADYLLALKANHGRAFEAVREHFERTCFGRGSGGRPVFDAVEDGQGPRQPGQPTRPAQEGRLERRLHAPAHRRPRSCVNPGVDRRSLRVVPGHAERPVRAALEQDQLRPGVRHLARDGRRRGAVAG